MRGFRAIQNRPLSQPEPDLPPDQQENSAPAEKNARAAKKSTATPETRTYPYVSAGKTGRNRNDDPASARIRRIRCAGDTETIEERTG